MRKALARSALIGMAGVVVTLPWLAVGTAGAAPSTVYVATNSDSAAGMCMPVVSTCALAWSICDRLRRAGK